MFFEDLKDRLRRIVALAVAQMAGSSDSAGSGGDAAVAESFFAMAKADTPFDETKGDVAIPMFPFAPALKKNPSQLASDACGILNSLLDCGDSRLEGLCVKKAEAAGGYVNFYLDAGKAFSYFAKEAAAAEGGMFSNGSMKGEKVMIEFSCPNTNKTLHLGHMRNDALGSCVSNLLKACGAEVMKVNLVNDRGIHICKSMLAYEKFMNGKTPQSEGVKSDKFIADCYVMYNEYEKREPENAKSEISEMLRKWESGDGKTRALWKKTREWALEGIGETYRNTNITFDKTYYESELYEYGRSWVMKGLEEGVFFKDASGAVMAKVDGKDKALLRSDGTSIYITQDIGTAFKRHEDFPYTQCVYVVGNEQIDHFKTLFAVLGMLKAPFAGKLHHLSYGMVNLPNGRMKSREGTVVDADDLLSDLERMSLENMSSDIAGERRLAVAHDVALAALNYYLLSFTPGKDVIFDSSKSISFAGNTGPYIQYSAARISSILAKAEEAAEERAKGAGADLTEGAPSQESDGNGLALPVERMLILRLISYPDCVGRAAREFDPSLLTSHVHDLCKVFSRYYHDIPVLKAEPGLRRQRLRLLAVTLDVIKDAMGILGIPYLPEM